MAIPGSCRRHNLRDDHCLYSNVSRCTLSFRYHRRLVDELVLVVVGIGHSQQMAVEEKMKYIVAVSGGIDSVVLLDLLVKEHNHELVVAHVNHGIRDDSNDDEQLVSELARSHGLAYESTALNLGKVSEDTARIARHSWLKQIRQTHQADYIATAHHEDDVIETMMINITRGTGWRGLCSLRNTGEYVRPLITWNKQGIVSYAIDNDLIWREDSTNDDMKFLRNRLRRIVETRIGNETRRQLLDLYTAQLGLRSEIEDELASIYQSVVSNGQLSRYFITMIDKQSAREILGEWLGGSLLTRRLDTLWIFAKTAQPGDRWSLDNQRFIRASKPRLIVEWSRDC